MQFTANREPRTANREQSSLNFFNFSKDKLLFIRICLASLLQKFNIGLVKSFLSFIKESKSSYFFEWQKSKQKTISFFVKKRNKKTTPFRIRNSLVKTFSQYSESPSLRGFAEAIYINWIASLLFAHSATARFQRVRLMAMTIKNNFAILNNNVAFASACRWQAHCVMQGVKTPCYLTLLTSITFDSLSEKIKNLRLVINFNFIQTRRIFK